MSLIDIMKEPVAWNEVEGGEQVKSRGVRNEMRNISVNELDWYFVRE